MARGVNKVIIVGNVAADPETRYMPSGGAVTNISVATNEQWTDKASGQKQERTEWHKITLFNRMAEVASEFLKKGSQVYIEGSIRTDKYQDKNTGEDKYSTSIIARDMQLLGGRNDGGQQQNTGGGAQQNAGGAPQAPPQPQSPPGADFGDSIPF